MAGSARRIPTGVGVAGRWIRSTPSTTSTSTGVLGGRMAWVAASENEVWIGWLVRCSEKQNDAESTICPSTSAKSLNPKLMIDVLMSASS